MQLLLETHYFSDHPYMAVSMATDSKSNQKMGESPKVFLFPKFNHYASQVASCKDALITWITAAG